MKPFNREKFLFYLLASVFAWQAVLFSFGVVMCFRQGGLKACPDLGDRYSDTVNVMVATTLALLGTSTILERNDKKEKLGNDSTDKTRRGPS